MGNFFSCSEAKEAKPLLSETKKAEGERKEENKKEDSPKEELSEKNLLAAVKVGDVAKIELLNKGGISIACKNEEGENPFHLAAKCGQIKVIELLGELKADVEAVDNVGRSAMHVAAEKGDVNVIEALHKLGAKVGSNHRIKYIGDGNSPLHLAAMTGKEAAVELLFKLGATDYDYEVNRKFQTPFEAAQASKQSALVKRWDAIKHKGLVGRNEKVVQAAKKIEKDLEMLAAAEAGDIVKIQSLNDGGVGSTPMHNAASGDGHVEVIELLVKLGAAADVNAQTYVSKETPLFEAALINDVKVIELLVKLGADVNALNSRGGTPLHRAAGNGKENAFEALYKLGAIDTFLETSDDGTKSQTPFELAKSLGRANLVSKWDEIKARCLEAREKNVREK